ncbi:class I SAM-dependent methyltransferase [Acholeplasma equirhinis]|uniref:tRNA (mnm(5)s(2)U34)-methyltransferase n=1 Tax=Acholeplasma equirhinis TaxID=555393 RepID=UPI00197AE31A|nr:class I SAM-dependent methyltransferase [Acholeplasma equirhinis]MBN3490799.1 class I SAM-dependent methyltransferase [Acholeplasma equirhinis]
MKNIKITDLAHELLETEITKDSVIVDATAGNGNDTKFLAERVKHVYTFDIQESALNQTRTLTKDFKNITYIHDTHEHILKYVQNFDGVVFNLGYLPGGDKKITTMTHSTIDTLEKLHKNQKGFILVVAYPGHLEGLKETVAVQSFLDKHEIKYRVVKFHHETKNEAPFIFFWKY